VKLSYWVALATCLFVVPVWLPVVSGCGATEYDTHSLSTSPLVTKWNHASNGFRSGLGYFGDAKKPKKRCCRASAGCMAPNLVLSTAWSSTVCDANEQYAIGQTFKEIEEVCSQPRKVLISTRRVKCEDE
jgi:hypothetical protein